jgi:hypothetical protein
MNNTVWRVSDHLGTPLLALGVSHSVAPSNYIVLAWLVTSAVTVGSPGVGPGKR